MLAVLLLMCSCTSLRFRRVALAGAISLTFSAPSFADDANFEFGKKMFDSSCAGCHAGGGNTTPFSGGKNLFADSLKKNGFYDIDAMTNLILKGNKAMPAYGEFLSQKGNVIPARYTEEQSKMIAQYVQSQADQGWKSP